MSHPSEYTGHNPKNCGYRFLSNYYNNLAGFSVAGSSQKRPEFVAMASFGGTPYSVNMPSDGSGAGGDILCNTWRRGECCDNRSLSRNAYSNCMSGICPSYYARSANY